MDETEYLNFKRLINYILEYPENIEAENQLETVNYMTKFLI